MNDAPMVELLEVSRWYGEVIGVNRVNASLRPGITGLLGPNGAGKSTLMNLMTGMIRPSQGKVLVYGEPVFGNHHLMNRLGFCSQYDRFYEGMTGLEFVKTFLKVRGWESNRAESGAISAMETVKMTEAMNRKIRAYSKGMRQRIKVALAIAHGPEVIIMDEPLNGLDAVGRHDMIELIRQFGREGRNVIISSHVLHEIEAMTDNILMMSGGYLVAEGQVKDVRESLRKHPHKVIIRCENPRKLAPHILENDYITSIRVDDIDGMLELETTSLDDFFPNFYEITLKGDFDVSLVSVSDENIRSIFEYLAVSGGKG